MTQPDRSMLSSLVPRAGTLMLALAGAATFHLLGLPLPFLFGPMSFCLAAALTGGSLRVLESAADRVERFLLERFPESCRIERTLASFEDVSG